MKRWTALLLEHIVTKGLHEGVLQCFIVKTPTVCTTNHRSCNARRIPNVARKRVPRNAGHKSGPCDQNGKMLLVSHDQLLCQILGYGIRVRKLLLLDKAHGLQGKTFYQ